MRQFRNKGPRRPGGVIFRPPTLEERLAAINSVAMRRLRELKEWQQRETGKEIARAFGGDAQRWGALASQVWARAEALHDEMGAASEGQTPEAIVRALAVELGINPDGAVAACGKLGGLEAVRG